MGAGEQPWARRNQPRRHQLSLGSRLDTGAGVQRAFHQLREDEIAALKADLAQLKEEFASANAKRRTKLQSRIDQLQARIDQQKKRAQEWLQAFQARGAVKRDLFEKKASAVGQALKELVKTSPT